MRARENKVATVGMREYPGGGPNVEMEIENPHEWPAAARTLYRKYFLKNKRSRMGHAIYGSLYAGSNKPFGTYHRQFGTGDNPTNLTNTFIINVEED
jgi:hypothetical protein